MKALAVVAVIFAISMVTCSALAATSDPRRCSAATPGGSAHHAYWCAKAAATTAVRTKMAAQQHLARWYYPTFCDEKGSLLRWSCRTIEGGDQWTATVRFVATHTGWHTYTAIVPVP